MHASENVAKFMISVKIVRRLLTGGVGGGGLAKNGPFCREASKKFTCKLIRGKYHETFALFGNFESLQPNEKSVRPRRPYSKLNMELDLQSLFGLLCTAVLIG